MRGSIRGLSREATAITSIEDACRNAHGSLNDVIDLLLIHNEGPVGGQAPRGVLNPLCVLLAVSAWERFVYDLAVLSDVSVGETETVGRLSLGTNAKSSKPGLKTREILALATADVLPHGLRVIDYQSATGKRLNRGSALGGSPERLDDVADAWDACIALRNGVAHRVVPERMTDAQWQSDAARHLPLDLQGRTVNTSIARTVVALAFQLIDQVISAALVRRKVTGTAYRELLLPGWWFADDLTASDGHRVITPGCLWRGTRIPRPWIDGSNPVPRGVTAAPTPG